MLRTHPIELADKGVRRIRFSILILSFLEFCSATAHVGLYILVLTVETSLPHLDAHLGLASRLSARR